MAFMRSILGNYSRFIMIFVLFLGLQHGAKARASEFFGVGDLNISANYALAPCESISELDCIDSVGFVSESGEFKAATFTRYTNQGKRINPADGVTLDFTGRSIWTLGGKEIDMDVHLESPKHVIWQENGIVKRVGASLRVWPRYNNIKNQKIRFGIRTSWLRPMNVQVKATDMDFKQQKIVGGNLWIIEGKGMAIANYSSSGNPRTVSQEIEAKYAADARADYEDDEFSVNIHHAGKDDSDSYWPPVCADKGYSVQSHNTNESGDPYWNGESLIFSIRSPHLRTNGELTKGYFWYKVSHSFLDCKFPGNTLTKSSKVEIEIIDENGNQSLATTRVQNSNGVLEVEAMGFHFSSPIIKIKPVRMEESISVSKSEAKSSDAEIAKSASNPEVAKTKSLPRESITCVKGKTVKKVTGTNPKCPTGYKKK